MKLKYLLPFIVSMIFFSWARLHPKGQELVVLKKQLPYEITNVSVSSTTLTIEGWSFINSNQHFINANTHSTAIEFTSSTDRFSVVATQQLKDMSHIMHYRGARTCGSNEYHKAPSSCNYTYKNVGFKVVVPLENFKKDKKYTAMIVVRAKQTNTKYKIQLFYPMKQPITKQIGDYQFQLQSAMKETRLIINHDNVVVRSGPTTSYPVIRAGTHCSDSYKNQLYYAKGQVFTAITDKVTINDISMYRLRGDILGCKSLRQRVKEGFDIEPIYIASTFVEYTGTMLSIENELINEPPKLNITHPSITLNEPFDYRDYASAYDPEEKDISSKIKVISNSYIDEVGYYQIQLFVEDKHGYSDQQTMNVTVVGPKNTSPILIVQDRTIKQFSFFDALEGVHAYDKEDGNLTNQITLENNVSTNSIGVFNQCYRVIDSMNASATQCALISVIERNVYVSHRFINKYITNLKHHSWKTSQREIQTQLNNIKSILSSSSPQ